MKTTRKRLAKPDFLQGKSGDEFAGDAQRIFTQKPDSHSAVAIVGTLVDLWDQKDAQAQANSANAARPRKAIDVTANEIEDVRKGYVTQYGTRRGFWKYAELTFDLDEKTLRARLNKKTRE